MEWTTEKPKKDGLYLRLNPKISFEVGVCKQTVFNVEGTLMTYHPQNEGAKLIPVDNMPDDFLYFFIPKPS